MKLARWCLNLHLKAEAREQLEGILKVNSKNPQAHAMLFSMEQDAALVAQRQRDPDVKQAGAEAMPERGPGALDSAVIHGAQRELNIVGMPVIFDLPTPLAIKRKNEFFRFVHPVLQHYCVKCHDGHYDGEFQLVPIMSRADNTPDAQRANLDAVLHLIDPENPAKSELLTSTLRAHGRGPRPRSIFPGSNDLTYQILATWVQSLRNPKRGSDLVPSQAMREGAQSAEAFAAGRDRIANESTAAAAAMTDNGGRLLQPAAGDPARNQIRRPSPMGLAAAGNRNGQAPAAPDDFPLPFVLTGKMPNLQNPSTPPGPAAKASRPIPPPNSALGRDAAAASKSQTPTRAGDPVEPPATKKKAKPLTIDPTLLERALQNRNNPR